MRKFEHLEFDDTDVVITVTMTEEDLREEYYPYWYKCMCEAYGREVVDRDYTFEDCIKDWKMVTLAKEIKDE